MNEKGNTVSKSTGIQVGLVISMISAAFVLGLIVATDRTRVNMLEERLEKQDMVLAELRSDINDVKQVIMRIDTTLTEMRSSVH